MSNMSVNVEFLAGTDIKDAIEEANIKAREWGVAYICFNFNGVSVNVRPHSLPWFEIIIASQKVIDTMNKEIKHVIV